MERYCFFVGGHVLGVGCSPLLADHEQAVAGVVEHCHKCFPGEPVTVWRMVRDAQGKWTGPGIDPDELP